MVEELVPFHQPCPAIIRPWPLLPARASALDPDRLARFKRENLAQRLARGPIPVDEAMLIAKQIAGILEKPRHDRYCS
jgi:hypothetical protein